MCCHTRTLKLYIDCAPQPPSRAEFSVLRLISNPPWVGPFSLPLLPPLPKPTAAHQQRGHCLRLRSWRAGRPRQGWASESSPCTSCCAFLRLCIAEGTTALWDLAKTCRVFIRKVQLLENANGQESGSKKAFCSLEERGRHVEHLSVTVTQY